MVENGPFYKSAFQNETEWPIPAYFRRAKMASASALHGNSFIFWNWVHSGKTHVLNLRQI